MLFQGGEERGRKRSTSAQQDIKIERSISPQRNVLTEGNYRDLISKEVNAILADIGKTENPSVTEVRLRTNLESYRRNQKTGVNATNLNAIKAYKGDILKYYIDKYKNNPNVKTFTKISNFLQYEKNNPNIKKLYEKNHHSLKGGRKHKTRKGKKSRRMTRKHR